MTIRILLADDHPIVREGLAAVLSTQPEFEIVGQANDGAEAVDLASALKPDIVVLDLAMAQLDGVQALRAMRTENKDLKVLVFTASETDDRIIGAVQAGAQGYLLKGAPREELFSAIRVIAKGGSLLSPVVAARLLERMGGPVTSLSEPLTEREREVLQLVAQGLQNKEIAARLGIRERTVKFHVSTILGKLGAANRVEAVRLAVQQGLVEM
ncbi:MAG TPA: response regulator transcription factor [Herpetosiphonaceae bacterium]|jgi:DNA-binding NarL/FixJ family response regulator|nr:response regulator transcription factor [Herpetosiphonaceae bacterium]